VAKDEITAAVDALLRQHPEWPARSLARMLREQTNGALTLEQCRGRINHRIHAAHRNAKHGRKSNESLSRPKRKAGTLRIPKSEAKLWTQYELSGKRIGILSDAHFPFHSEMAIEAAVGTLKEHKIDHLLLNGDWADHYAQSFHERKPSLRNFKAERTKTIESLAWIRDQFPRIKITYKLGNHEERWYRWLYAHAPEIGEEPDLDFAAWFRLSEYDIDCVQDQRIVMAGKLAIAHGHELGKGMTSPVNPARGAFLRTLHTILVGHHHRTSGHCESNLWHDEVFVWSTGCLCDLNPEYARVNKWNHGFALVEVAKNNDFEVTNYRISPKGIVRAS